MIHVVVDDAMSSGSGVDDVWYGSYFHRTRTTVGLCRYYEKLQTSEGVARVLSWAKTTGLLSESDLFISADVDEVLSGPAL